MEQQETFKERPVEDWSAEREALLQRNIHELGLKIEGTRIEAIVAQLHAELESAGINLKPKVYLSNEWGCPEGIPIIGMPFYLADEKLSRLENEIMDGIEAESDEDILRYLRHEAGNAFNYAYKLYETPEWHELFGPYSRPYREDYEPNPFSRNFVRHIAGWYAQKHPDEDFAETFAVWLTPNSNWRQMYAGWSCWPKLEYVSRIVAERGRTAPIVSAEDYDSGEELAYSIAEHYRQFGHRQIEVPAYFDGDLRDLFETGAPPDTDMAWLWAADFLIGRRRSMVENIAYWTGLNDALVRSLLDHFVERCREMNLWLLESKSIDLLAELTAYATTLCMNRLYKGDFVIK